MRMILVLTAAMFIAIPAQAAMSGAPSGPIYEQDSISHGGGCRKSSPPGQCCHMDRKAGVVHCH